MQVLAAYLSMLQPVNKILDEFCKNVAAAVPNRSATQSSLDGLLTILQVLSLAVRESPNSLAVPTLSRAWHALLLCLATKGCSFQCLPLLCSAGTCSVQAEVVEQNSPMSLRSCRSDHVWKLSRQKRVPSPARTPLSCVLQPVTRDPLQNSYPSAEHTWLALQWKLFHDETRLLAREESRSEGGGIEHTRRSSTQQLGPMDSLEGAGSKTGEEGAGYFGGGVARAAAALKAGAAAVKARIGTADDVDGQLVRALPRPEQTSVPARAALAR